MEKVDFRALEGTAVTWTLLGTLYLRAYESRGPQSILRDHYADEALDRIEYDWDALAKKLAPAVNQWLVALRSLQLDTWTSDFLARHPDAVVLHLGCGLDSRALRLDVPPGVDWYDVDIPEVIDLRRRIYPEESAAYTMIGASVTSPDWLASIPRDRPALVVAEGLLMYLPEAEVRALLQRLAAHLAGGELVFDGMTPSVPRTRKIFKWGLRSGHEVEAMEPRFRLEEAVPWATHWAKVPAAGVRRVYRFCHAVPYFRTIFREYRYSF